MGKGTVKGIEIRGEADRGQSYRLSFTYKGVYCREAISLKVTPANTRYTERLLGEIQNAIERGTFRYADYFPNSKRCEMFGRTSQNTTVLSCLEEYMANAERRNLSLSTIHGYKKIVRALSPLHKIMVSELTPADVKRWLTSQKTTEKTLQNQISLLKSSLRDAVVDGVMKDNPVSDISISNYATKRNKVQKIDPFTPDEIETILSRTENAMLRSVFAFAFHTGLRSSELIAVQWKKIDFDKKLLLVDQALVLGQLKQPKTVRSDRLVELDDVAIDALLSMKALQHPSEFVFINPQTDKPWTTADQLRKTAWKPLLDLYGVRYRKAYNTRHTFATMHISRGANIWWLCGQMGHTTPNMLFKHYGAYIKEFQNEDTGR